MHEILSLLPVLLCLIAMNIALGLYNSIGVKKISFSKRKLWDGILKAAIISGSFLGLAYCFDTIDLSTIGVTPQFIIHSSILIYAGKVLLALANILGVDITKNIHIETK